MGREAAVGTFIPACQRHGQRELGVVLVPGDTTQRLQAPRVTAGTHQAVGELTVHRERGGSVGGAVA